MKYRGEVLQKAIAAGGFASRRAAEKLITAGQVRVNGRVVTKLGTRVNGEKDKITVSGQPLVASAAKVYFLLHKPKGIVSTVQDDRGRKTVISLVPTRERVVPVGRLDINSSGLLLLSNDGELVFKLTHPKFEHEKEYEVLIQVPHDWKKENVKNALFRLRQGVRLVDGVKSAPAQSEIKEQISNDRYLVSITIHEGRKHQVRQMINAVGATVVELKRVRMGPIKLGDLAEGEWRELTAKELDDLASIF